MMSELEKRIVREIFGEDESSRMQRESEREDNWGRRRAYIWLVAYILFLFLGIESWGWLNTTNPVYLVTHIFIVNVVSGIILICDIALWVLLIFGFALYESVSGVMSYVIYFLSILGIFFAIAGAIVTYLAFTMPSELWIGLHHPFSPGGMSITPISSLIGLPPNVTLSSGNSTYSLYLVGLSVNINGMPINATLVVRDAVFSNPFNSITCIFYNSNVGAQQLPMVVHVTPSLVDALLSNSNNGHPVIKLSFLCNGIPTKAVLVTNYGNFTYLLSN